MATGRRRDARIFVVPGHCVQNSTCPRSLGPWVTTDRFLRGGAHVVRHMLRHVVRHMLRHVVRLLTMTWDSCSVNWDQAPPGSLHINWFSLPA